MLVPLGLSAHSSPFILFPGRVGAGVWSGLFLRSLLDPGIPQRGGEGAAGPAWYGDWCSSRILSAPLPSPLLPAYSAGALQLFPTDNTSL